MIKTQSGSSNMHAMWFGKSHSEGIARRRSTDPVRPLEWPGPFRHDCFHGDLDNAMPYFEWKLVVWVVDLCLKGLLETVHPGASERWMLADSYRCCAAASREWGVKLLWWSRKRKEVILNSAAAAWSLYCWCVDACQWDASSDLLLQHVTNIGSSGKRIVEGLWLSGIRLPKSILERSIVTTAEWSHFWYRQLSPKIGHNDMISFGSKTTY